MPLDRPWIEGFVLDRHVISSVPIGYLGEHMPAEAREPAHDPVPTRAGRSAIARTLVTKID
jgi:hypothetical protein